MGGIMTTEQSNNAIQNAPADMRVRLFRVNMPAWLQILHPEHEVITSCTDALRAFTSKVKFLRDNKTGKIFADSEFFSALETVDIDTNHGAITYNLVPQPDLYFKVISKLAGVEITSDAGLVSYIREVASIRVEYEKVRGALNSAQTSGYGVVTPAWEDFGLEQPALHKSGKNFGVKLRSSASSLHIVRVDVKSEVNPIIGSEAQSQEMLKFLQAEYTNNKQAVWDTPIFGKSLESIVREDISSKSNSMPVAAQTKMRSALTKIVNNGKGGVICILI